jgi:hypothetical protein
MKAEVSQTQQFQLILCMNPLLWARQAVFVGFQLEISKLRASMPIIYICKLIEVQKIVFDG